MGVCSRNGSDRLLRQLVSKGINIILPPRDDLKPGSLIVASKQATARLADWKIVLGVEPPVKSKPEPTFKAMSFTTSDALEASAGASLLGRVLQGLGVSPGNLATTFKNTGATSLNISLSAPAAASLENLDEMLEALRQADAALRPGYKQYRSLIVEKVWRAKGLSLELMRSDGTHVALTAELLDQLRGDAKLEVVDRGDGRITFLAQTALIFGVTLRELVITKDGVTDKSPSAHYQFRGGEGEAGGYPELSDDLFSTLENEPAEA